MIHVHGYLGEISPATRSLAGRVALVVGGRRHLDALGVPDDYSLICYLPIGAADEECKRAVKKSFSDRAWFNGFKTDET